MTSPGRTAEKASTNASSGSLLPSNGVREEVRNPISVQNKRKDKSAAGLSLNRANILCFPFSNFLHASLLPVRKSAPTVKENVERDGSLQGMD